MAPAKRTLNPFEEDTEDSFIRGHVHREEIKPVARQDRDKLDELEQMALDALDEI